MGAIPVRFDQLGVAARIGHQGVGEFVEVGELSADLLGGLINKVMWQPPYRKNARDDLKAHCGYPRSGRCRGDN
jgi:zeaxanthin glucosyltransferase